MQAINILFLAPHWRVTLIKAFRKALEELQCSGTLVGLDSDPYSPTLRVMDSVDVIPRFTAPECLREILDFCRCETVHAVIPLTNKAVEFLDANRTAFQEEGIRVFLNEQTVIETCHDKYRLAQFFREQGILAPQTFLGDSNEVGGSFPLFAKQRRGEGGTHSMVLQDESDLEYCRKKYPDHMIQQLLAGKEYSIDWYSDGDGNPVVIVPRERLAIRAGEVRVSRIHLKREVIDAVRHAGSRIGLQGPCNLQGILDEAGKFYFIDINLRFGSGSVHSIAAGANIPYLIYQEIAGQSLPSGIGPLKDGMVMTRFNDSYYIEEQNR
ncbi:MAG: ATP-grasp domain-containing protein [Nitrospinota bacterium]|nr:ATP-grasp domain-containing protein [Nitrospinota bacterium]